MKKIHIIGGGTVFHVRNHLALAAVAYGKTARKLYNLFHEQTGLGWGDAPVKMHLTKMAGGAGLETNEDVAALIDRLVADPETRVIIMNAALCDYDGQIMRAPTQDEFFDQPAMQRAVLVGTTSGKYETRLRTSDGNQMMALEPAEKIISRIRRERKDIFLVAFKTTCGATPDEQYLAALDLLKRNSANLVLANDTKTRHNMIVAPEETRYFEGEREQCLMGLVEMVLARMSNTFTRSTVVEGELVPFQTSPLVPENLRAVVNHLVERGAYKPFNGATAGHFAVRYDEQTCLTSRRKTDYTKPGGIDLVRVEYEGLNKVIAYGAKPSVGGQSQRIVFEEHEGLDCIVHAHVPLRSDAPDNIPVAPQWQAECGSFDCGRNTSRNLKEFEHGIHAVMLEGHGPNVVFSRDTPAERVIEFIERNFDLTDKTGGLFVSERKVYA
jgi:hypothetical protein